MELMSPCTQLKAETNVMPKWGYLPRYYWYSA